MQPRSKTIAAILALLAITAASAAAQTAAIRKDLSDNTVDENIVIEGTWNIGAGGSVDFATGDFIYPPSIATDLEVTNALDAFSANPTSVQGFDISAWYDDLGLTTTFYTQSAAAAAFEPLGVASADITDATATGQAAIAAADAAALRDAAGATAGVLPGSFVDATNLVAYDVPRTQHAGRLRTAWRKLFNLYQGRNPDNADSDIGYGAMVVANAGTAAANGTYTVSGTLNSKPRKSKGDDYDIRWSGAQWQIYDSATPQVLYTNPDTGDTVPTSGWVASAGASPAPSVEYYGNRTLRFASIGDSVGQRPANLIAERLTHMFSEQAYDPPHPSVGSLQNHLGLQPSTVNITTTGTIHSKNGGTPDYTLFYTGTYYELDTGQELIVESPFNPNGLVDADTIKIFYVRDSGLGQFDVQLSTTSDSSGFVDEQTNIATANGIKTAGVLTITKTPGDYAVRIVADTDNVKIIGVDIWNSQKPQVLFYPTATSSLTPDSQFALWDDNIAQVVMDEWPLDLITWNYADSTASQSATSWTVLENMVGYLRRVPSVVLFDNLQDEISDDLRTLAETNGWYLYSMYDAFGASLANLEAEGLASTDDAAHKSMELYQFASAQVLRDLVPWSLLTSYPAPVFQDTNKSPWSVESANFEIPVRDGISYVDREDNVLLDLDPVEPNFSGRVPLDWVTTQTNGVKIAVDTVRVASAEPWATTTDFTIHFVGYPDRAASAASGNVVQWGAPSIDIDGGNAGFEFALNSQGAGVKQPGMELLISNGSTVRNIIFDGDFNDRFGAHTVTYDHSSGDVKYYFNGVLRVTNTGSPVDWHQASVDTLTLFNGGSRVRDFAGYASLFSMADEVLSAAEVAALIENPATVGLKSDLLLDFTTGQGVFEVDQKQGIVFSNVGGLANPEWLFPRPASLITAVTASLDFPSIATDSSDTLTITHPAARTGSGQMVQLQPDRIGQITLHGHISAANTITVTALNNTAGSIDPTSTSITALITETDQ